MTIQYDTQQHQYPQYDNICESFNRAGLLSQEHKKCPINANYHCQKRNQKSKDIWDHPLDYKGSQRNPQSPTNIRTG